MWRMLKILFRKREIKTTLKGDSGYFNDQGWYVMKPKGWKIGVEMSPDYNTVRANMESLKEHMFKGEGRKEMKTTVKLLDIVKECRTMNTIRVQELASTVDPHTLLALYKAYTSTVMEGLTQHSGEEVKYSEFYQRVLSKL